jgi:copper chaperone CopZ
MATMLLKVDGLGAGDEDRLKEALREMPGVFGVVVSPREGCAEVDFEDDEVDYTRILERIREAGFSARLSG